MSMAWDRSNVSREFQGAKAPIRKGLNRVDPENLDHALFLYDLISEQEPANLQTFNDHVTFVRGRPYLAWYLIGSAEAELVGSIYLTRRREIGLVIQKARQRQGHGGMAVKELMRMHEDKDEPFLANINPSDQASIRFWTSLGFEIKQVTYGRAGSAPPPQH
jgi:RimJ/RimL family protein N-acetyltransferase